MLEGLEAVEINKSAINDESRYEAEFFRKRFLAEDNALAVLPQATLGSFAAVTDGPHGYHVVDESSEVVMLTAKNALNWFSDRDNADPIAEFVDLQNKRSSLCKGDVILSTRGTVGKCALVVQESLPANIDQDVARISWDERHTFLPEFVVVYLNSRYGQDHIARHASGMVQQGISLHKVRNIPLPHVSLKTQQAISAIVLLALNQKRKSKELYICAETILLDALGLRDWQPPQSLSYESSSSAAFVSGRLDAEYFQPKYELFFQQLQQAVSVNGWTLEVLGELSSPLKYGTSTELEYLEKGVPFLRIADLSNREFEPETLKYISYEASTKEHAAAVATNDVLISRSGTLGLTVAIPHELNGAIFGSYFIRTRPNKDRLNPVFLALFINSLAGRLQIEQLNTGGIQTNLTIPAIESLKIPLPSLIEQTQYIKRVFTAQAARQQAKQLLEAAKRAVEIAIEDSEAAALQFLQAATTGAPNNEI